MKKIFFCLLLVATVTACKKDSSGSSSKMLLSKAYFKGLLETEYIYDINGRIIRVNNYSTAGGQSKLSTYQLYEHNNDGTISQVFHFTDNYEPTDRKVYTYSAQSKVTRIDEATIFTGDADLDNMDYFEVYNYNASGQLTSRSRKYTNMTQHSHRDFAYDESGNLATYEDWYWENGGWVLKQKAEINPGAKPMPAHWKAMLVMPTDMNLYQFYITGMKFTSYWLGPAGNISTWSFSDRQYNNEGYVIKETLSIESFGSTNANEHSYEYVKL